MPTTINGSNAWTASTTVPATGEPRNASDISTPTQALMNRTEYLKESGADRIRTAATLAALKAITGHATGDHVFLDGKGIYTFNAGSTATPDDDLVVQPGAGGGRWLLSLEDRQHAAAAVGIGATGITYDAWGRVTTVTNTPQTTTYTTGDYGQVASATDGTRTTTITRDGNGRITGISEA